MIYSGVLEKMVTAYDEASGKVSYALNLDGVAACPLNEWVGHDVEVSFDGKINCTQCGRSIRKTYNDGFCYPCLTTLPQADICMVKPELCHFHRGTCRDSQWGEQHCFIPHTLYLARSSGIKIGITRGTHPRSRWMDQGAVEAMAIGYFPSRYEVGLAEKAISGVLSDKTNWRKMLTNDVTDVPFDAFLERAGEVLSDAQRAQLIESPRSQHLRYPVLAYPEKVKSFKLDKVPQFKKTLTGIKGQYLMFGHEVLNLRAHSGYNIALQLD